MKTNMKKSILILLVTLLFAVMLSACGKDKIDMERFEVNLKYGYGNSLRMGSYAPFYIDVTNHGKDFGGTIQLIVPNATGNALYEKEISIPAGATKSVMLVGEIPEKIHNVNIRIGEDAENIVWKKLFLVDVTDVNEDINVGILSDDYTALGYMDRQTSPLFPSYKTRIYEMNAESFPDDAHALDMLDVIVVSDFSTDILTEHQISALRLWNSDGGFLIVGTGSTYNKTLSKLNHDFFEVQPGDLQKYSTKFGLSLRTEASALPEELYENKSPYGDENYEKVFGEIYLSDIAALEEFYLTRFLDIYGYTQEDYQNDAPDGYIREEFYWYCFEEYFYEFYLYGLYLEDFENKSKQQEELPYVEGDVLAIDIDSSVVKSVFEAEIENSSKTFPLGYTLPIGSGNIFLATVDFTKNPLSRYEGNEDLFVFIVQDAIKEMNSINENGYFLEDFKNRLGDLTSGAQIPSIVVYGIFFLGYLVAIIAFYIVYSKKKKTTRLWIVYPILSVAFAILIYCAGFSTRLLRPYLNVVSVLELQGPVVSKTSMMGIIVPNDKRYEVSLSKQYAVTTGIGNEWDYAWDEANCDYDSYTSSFSNGLDDNKIIIEHESALKCRNVLLRNSYHTDKEIEVKHTASDAYAVTNNYGVDLEAAYIYADSKLFYIGEIKSGETVTVTENEYVSRYSIEDEVSKKYREENMFDVMSGLFLGSLSPQYNSYHRGVLGIIASSEFIDMKNEMMYFMDSTDLESSNMRVFAAVPVKTEKGIYQETSKYRENCAEVICMLQDNAITK